MVPPVPVGLLLPAPGRVRARSVHAGRQPAECTVPRDRSRTVRHCGRLCAVARPTEARNARDAPDTHAQRRRSALLDRHHARLCHLAGLDDDQECAALPTLRAGRVRLADGVLSELLHGTLSVDTEDDVLCVLPVSG